MQKKSINTKTNPVEHIGSQRLFLLSFDLPKLVLKMKNEINVDEMDYNSLFLIDRPEKQIVLTALHEGTKINSFQSNDLISFQIIEGKLKFNSKKESVTLQKGQLLTLKENIKYTLTSKTETIFLLTIANDTKCNTNIT